MPHTVDMSQSQHLRLTTLVPGFDDVDLPEPPTGCLLNIDVYWHMKSSYKWLHGNWHNSIHGNYSTWIPVEIGESIAVTRMYGCASIFIANQNWSHIAAAHIGGSPQYIEEWCDELLADHYQPHYIVYTTSDQDQYRYHQVLQQYLDKLEVRVDCCLWAKRCGAVLVQRTNNNQAVIFAGGGTSNITVPKNGIDQSAEPAIGNQ